MRPKQDVTFKIDAYPQNDVPWSGRELVARHWIQFLVASTAENATGNWVKVVQRLPVRISIDNPPDDLPFARRPKRHGEGGYAPPTPLSSAAAQATTADDG